MKEIMGKNNIEKRRLILLKLTIETKLVLWNDSKSRGISLGLIPSSYKYLPCDMIIKI